MNDFLFVDLSSLFSVREVKKDMRIKKIIRLQIRT